MIYGKKVRLRAIERDDIPRFVKWFNDPEVRQHLLMYSPMSLVQEENWFEQHAQRHPAEQVLAIEVLAEDGEGVHIGNMGLHDVNWKDRNAELGIVIGEKAYWGQGYGTDAITALLAHGFEELNLHRVRLRVNADNPRGIRCYEKCGFCHEGTLRESVFAGGKYKDQHIMAVLRSEFRADQKE
jgi:RimJ/RimL family protein N-acetyltransferase